MHKAWHVGKNLGLNGNEVREAVEMFRSAAELAKKAGFDGVEIHGANGYLIDQFTQDVCNQRTDGWGGSVEKRARFGLEVAQACCEAIGPEKVGMRLSPWSVFQGMGMKDPLPQFSYMVRGLKDLEQCSPDDQQLLKEIHSHLEAHGDAVKGKETSPLLVRL